jgi:predicted nicotinamide N-methyase
MPLFRAGAARAFVRRHTTLRDIAELPGLRLHLSDDLLDVWRSVQLELADDDAPMPYWAAAWAGGLAVASLIRERPEVVTGRRVLDFGSGSGLVGIAAMQAGAANVDAVDIDPFAMAAIQLNARANDVRVSPMRRDMIGEPPPAEIDVLLAADCWYEAGLASVVTPWLTSVAAAGVDVLIGDPGRRFLPAEALEEIAEYEVRTTSALEDQDQRMARVYRLR